MKILLAILCFLAAYSSAFGQQAEPILAKVLYRLVHRLDTTDMFPKRDEIYVTLLGRNLAVYQSYERLVQDSVLLDSYRTTHDFLYR